MDKETDKARLNAVTPAQSSPAKRRRRGLVVVAAMACVIAIVGAAYWFLNRNYESTDDAFVDGNVVRISPRVSGTVVRVLVGDNQRVHKGQLLLEIDPSDYKTALAAAKADLDAALASQQTARAGLDLVRITSSAGVTQASAGLTQARSAVAQAEAQAVAAQAEALKAKSDMERYRSLFAHHSVSKEMLDQAIAIAHTTAARWKAAQKAVSVAEARVSQALGRLSDANSAPEQVAVREAGVKSAQARVEQANAALDQARLNLSYTKIYAPESGRITKKSVEPGDFVQKGQILTALVYGTPWVTANFKETQLARMRPGQPVDISVDAYPGRAFKGRVDSIQAGTGSRFSLLPPENATGNYVKVVQRVPVKIVFDEPPGPGTTLALGMSVEPRVDVAVQPEHVAGSAADAAAGKVN